MPKRLTFNVKLVISPCSMQMADAGSPGSQDSRNSDDADRENCNVREQDRFMPIANVIRIMRKVLPGHAKISDDAKETLQECVSEFISFITGEANDKCQREQRKTITADDVLWAMDKLGFDQYVGPLTLYLLRYRETEGDRRGSTRGEPHPKKDPNALPISTNASTGHSCFYGRKGYYKDSITGAILPFLPDSFSPYK
ncbi:hypothetical protein O6H91_15G007300 [Diphasiastrum complanatum]|uniref:Uncharacterized protein n=1 Tax=Diphasiastrum complanatum TaxID=34168 RepID=A0ACC2BFE5_DIPCM|nr:hypothetical protein O6H91_15G007300 [Diphasiastrum complanatum]